MAMNILIGKTSIASIADIVSARLAAQALLAAKKELVSMSTAIDAAAAKGNYQLSYRLSGSITRLAGINYDNAIDIIEDDIEAAGYEYKPDKKGTILIGYTLNWGEPWPVEETGEHTGEETGNNTATTEEEATTDEEATTEAATTEEEEETTEEEATTEEAATTEENPE